MTVLTSKPTTKTRLIENFGHMCGLDTEPDLLFVQHPKSNVWDKFQLYLHKLAVVSELNPRTNKYCRSQTALHLEKLKQLEHYRFIMHPLSNLRKYWEYFMIVTITIALIIRPMYGCFACIPNIMVSSMFNTSLLVYTHYILDACYILDTIINFFTGYYNDQREIVLRKQEIAKHYLKTFFVTDFLSGLPCDIDPQSIVTKLTFMFILRGVILQLKFLRIFRYIQYISHWLEVLKVRTYCCKVVVLVVSIVMVLHGISCASILISALSTGIVHTGGIPLQSSWLTEHNLYNSSIALIYVTSLFRTSCIMSSAEYESMDTSTSADQWFTCILWVLSMILYTVFVSLLVQITRAVTSPQSKYREMVLQLMQYMHHKQLSPYTQRRLIAYHEFRFKKTFFRDIDILNSISGRLRQEILMLKCLKLVENVPFFKGLPESLLMKIVSYLRLEIFLANDIIIKCKTYTTCMYFIGFGTVALISESGKEIYHLEDGEYFGEVELVVPDTARVANVIAIETSEVYRLDRADFIHAIRPYPDLLDAIEQVAAERMQHIQAIDNKYKYFHKQRCTTTIDMDQTRD